MYECPNCGGNLKFDIASQLLKCDYCQTTKDPYEVTKDRDAEESNAFDVTIFTCPQCGGEILSTDTSAAEFCSFCGASTILDSRISREKRPTRIIPFKITKEACKKAYIARMKRAIFAPDDLKDAKYIDSFRGIYMPYFAYRISQQGTVHLKGEKSYRKGDYLYKEQYALSGDIDAYYHDLSYDASSSFSDSISEQVAPFKVKDMQKFTPSFLSGFYADTADVDSSLYREDALKFANTNSYSKVKSNSAFSGISISGENNTKDLNTTLCTAMDTPERVMYPVWFMSYRKNDRVAYVTINGQTGKMAADIPVDIKKYGLGTLLLAIPIFILLNLFFTIKPTAVLGFAALLAIVTMILSLIEITKINQRDNRTDDKGYQFHQKKRVISPSKNKQKVPGFIGSLTAVIIAALIYFLNPVSDIWYYGGAILAFAGILFTIVDIIKEYNVLVTRKLPQFDRKGGDDNA
ncbi:MAG: hypothetical protein ACI4ED_06310 [Suilimivivens sp.]